MTSLFPDKVVVKIGIKKYETKIVSGKHQWIADEPEDLQGTDLGPNPNQLLASSLGACTAITIRMYADRKSMPLDEVTVELTIDKVSPEDHTITRVVHLSGNLSDAERERLIQVANACPVHKLLSGKITIETKSA
ncbi:MAG: OsmC family protein [Leptospira sp.]|nr:OsmC family protein [Leptospira sp.]